MFFANKAQVIAYLTRSGIVFYSNAGQAKLDFAPNEVMNLDVVDKNRLVESVHQFASKQQVNKKRVLCLLDDSVIFQKTIPINGPDLNKIAADFISKVPFDSDIKAVINLQVKDQLIVVAANAAFYSAVAQALAELGNKILAVTPAAIYRQGKLSKLDEAAVKKILDHSHFADRANFLKIH